MPDFNDFNNNAGDVVTGVETVKKSKTGLIVGVVAVLTAGAVTVVAGGGVAAYCLSDFVKNQVKLRISSPEKYYAWVNEENAGDFSKKVAESYSRSLDKIDDGQTSEISFKYEPTDDLKDLMIDELGLDNGGDEADQIIDIIQNIDSIAIGANGQAKESLIDGSIYCDLNDDRLITCDIASDSSTMDYFVRIPELTEKWLGIDAGKMIEDNTYDDDEAAIIESYKKAMKDPASILTPEEIEQETARYVKVWNDSVGDVTLNKKETVTINDIDMNYAVVSVEIDEKKAHTIAKNFIESAKDDELLKEIVVDRLDAMSSSEYDDALDDALEDLKDVAEEELSDDTVTVSTYIDAKGKIRGFKVAGEDENEEFMAIIGKDGDKVRGESYLLDGDSEPEFKIELTADGKNDVYTGNIDFTADGETVSVEFDDFEIVNKDRGYFNANTRIIIPEIDPIAIDFTSDGKSQSIAGDVIIDGTNYGRATFTFGVQDGAEPSVPSKNNALMISDPDEMEDQLKEYVSENEMYTFIADFCEKIGLETDLAEEIAENAVEELYEERSSSSSYGYGYDDDYGWDDDYSSAAKTTTKAGSSSSNTTTTTTQSNDDYFSDYIEPDDGQAYITVIDKEYSAYFIGWGKDDLAKGSSFADVKGNGEFTASIKASTAEPEGFSILGISMSGAKKEAVMKIKSLKIDGKEIKLDKEPAVSNSFGYIDCIIYAADEEKDSYTYSMDDYENAVDLSNYGKWKNIEITFEMSNNE